ncbi:MAG: Gfo/Idh/MocA family oxidoreductase [Lentisphaerae bacterium]|nr:Gfo/Idh/MocA family oxidoreductase [Lentisphaerota bacterium]
MPQKLRAAVIGLGMGRHHAREYAEHRRVELVALADPDADRLAEIGNLHKVPRLYADARKMLRDEDLDLVSVATPNAYHAPLSIAALQAGCHVLCEKPMAMNARQARRMAETARSAGRRLMINFSYRFDPQSRALKREVDRGVLGDVYFGRTVWLRRQGVPERESFFLQSHSGGGPLIDLGVHRLDLALWLMGHPKPRWVMAGTYDHLARAWARKKGYRYEVEDLAVALIRFDNGATLEVESSWMSHIQEQELMHTRLLGTRGGLVHRNVDGRYVFEGHIYTERRGKPVDIRPQPPARKTSAMQHFVSCILNGTPHTATGEEGLVVMQVLDALYRSAAEKRPVRIR